MVFIFIFYNFCLSWKESESSKKRKPKVVGERNRGEERGREIDCQGFQFGNGELAL